MIVSGLAVRAPSKVSLSAKFAITPVGRLWSPPGAFVWRWRSHGNQASASLLSVSRLLSRCFMISEYILRVVDQPFSFPFGETLNFSCFNLLARLSLKTHTDTHAHSQYIGFCLVGGINIQRHHVPNCLGNHRQRGFQSN